MVMIPSGVEHTIPLFMPVGIIGTPRCSIITRTMATIIMQMLVVEDPVELRGLLVQREVAAMCARE